MYSPIICDRRLHKAKKEGLAWKRLPRDRSIDIASKLEQLRYDGQGRLLPDGQLRRPLFKEEEEFVDSERLICKCDFEYWFTRYAVLELDGGVLEGRGMAEGKKLGPPLLLESQKRYITLLGRREEECYEELRKYQLTRGIMAYFHKVRQVAATTTARAMTIHRLMFWPGTRALAAALDEKGKNELFTRDHIILDNLPFWMKLRLSADVKDTEIGFDAPTSSRISYQAENQTQGIGTGSQNDVSHLNEVGLWNYPGRIEFSFTPTLPKAITTLHIQESTSNGKGNYWHEVTEAARHKRRGYESWTYAFIPWYMNKLKYRDNPPSNWVPEPHTIQHAELVERTSPEFMDGVSVQLSLEQLYWWETDRARHVQKGELAYFLTNYAATPEQSFQSSSQGALPVELIEKMELECRDGAPYDVEVQEAA